LLWSLRIACLIGTVTATYELENFFGSLKGMLGEV
jgi:hypothetical protein